MAGGGSEDTVFVYRVSEDTWEEAPRLNTARDAPGLGIIGEVSYDWWTRATYRAVIGGQQSRVTYRAVIGGHVSRAEL